MGVPMQSRRVKRLSIEASVIVNNILLKGGEMMPHLQVNDLPEDAEVIGIQLDPVYHDRIWVYIWSASYDVVPDGEPTPELTITVSVWYCNEYLKRLKGAVADEPTSLSLTPETPR